jgi:hypothetical protein
VHLFLQSLFFINAITAVQVLTFSEAFKASVNESYKKVKDFLVNIEKTGKTKAGK